MQRPKPPLTNMKVERMKRRISQQQLGEMIGVTQGYVFQLESLMGFPSLKRQRQLEEIFDKPIKYLLSVVD